MSRRNRKNKISEYDDIIEPEPKNGSISSLRRKKKIFENEKKYHIDFQAKTKNQQIAWQYFQEKPIVVLSGSAGTGKTFIANFFACEQLVKGNYERFIVTRNAIGCGKSIGFFPGDVNEKLSVWLQNVISYCKQFVGINTVDIWLKGDHPKLILEPTEVIRGRSYNNSIILVEEAQQLSVDEIKCLTTRVGENSLLILAGDPKQKDIKEDGLEKFCNLVEKYNISDVGIVKFTPNDILRHDVVRKLILAFEKEGL